MNEEYLEALRLADLLDGGLYSDQMHGVMVQAADELRRLVRVAQRLEDKLSDIYYQNSIQGDR